MPNVKPKPFEQMEREYAEEITRLAQLAHQRYCRNLHEPLYLAGTKRKDGIWNRLTVATEMEIEARDELFIVHLAPLSRAKTLDQQYWAIKTMLGQEPLWIFAE